ncbi:hypothetical protein AVEN_170303-1, partial [Araneus ventricosus]
FGCLIILTGVPVYFLFIYWENKPACVKSGIDSFTRFLQKLLVVVAAEKPTDV